MMSSLAALAKVLSRRIAVAMLVNEPWSRFGKLGNSWRFAERWEAYGTVNRYLTGILVYLFDHELSSAVAFKSGRVRIAFRKRGFGNPRLRVAGRVVSQRLRCEIFRREYSLPF